MYRSPQPVHNDQYQMQETRFSPHQERGSPFADPYHQVDNQPLLRQPQGGSPFIGHAPSPHPPQHGGMVGFQPSSPGPHYGGAPRRVPRRYKTSKHNDKFLFRKIKKDDFWLRSV